jgi:predicted CXXCH cytochrome family protein
MRISILLLLGLCLGVPASRLAAQPSSVVNSPHNLSASGPGPVRAVSEDQVCIFCHTPHNASPLRPLWNRAIPVDGYTIYTSRALTAKPGQPTGMSKMCLSCHDGTIALGNVVSRSTPIAMSGGVTTIPVGPSHIGTDLRDDHPISFRFDSGLASKNLKLKAPSALPSEVRLDSNAELQCTTCHDAHNNSLGKFMVMRNDNSELCNACHQMGTTSISAHQNCDACHQPHSAPSGPYLLRKQTISDTCLGCHNGSLPGSTSVNIAPELNKVYTHDTHSPVDPPEPLTDHVSCTDCHEAHTMTTGSSPPPGLHGNFGKVSGVSASGSPLTAASSEFEVCFKCHGDKDTRKPWVSRRIQEVNTRQQFSPSAISFHPVEASGRNSNVPSLKPEWTVASRVACTSCHGSDTSRAAGGSGPNGLHGSNFGPNLIARYETKDYTTESEQSYALCYTCHDRGNILENRSFLGHKRHIVDLQTPCAACHDAHGIASTQGTKTGNAKLINFASSIVFPDKVTGRLEYIDGGSGQGQCFLSCHNANHSPLSYSTITPPPSSLRRRGR